MGYTYESIEPRRNIVIQINPRLRVLPLVAHGDEEYFSFSVPERITRHSLYAWHHRDAAAAYDNNTVLVYPTVVLASEVFSPLLQQYKAKWR